MVSEGYINRLQKYITESASAQARRPGDKGVNAYSRYTERILSEWGMSGFAAGQISRWLRGEVKAELDGSTLQRLGLLKGLSREPEEAGKLAWAWLNGEEVQELEPLPSSPTVAELPASYEAIPNSIVEQINEGQYGARELREIAIAAIQRLTAIAEDCKEHDALTSQRWTLSWLLKDWMKDRGKTLEDLAATIGVSVERAQEIMDCQPLTIPECMAVAGLTRLKPETIAEWGLCPSFVAGLPVDDRT